MQVPDIIRKHGRKIAFAIWGVPFFIFGSTKPDTPPVVVTEGIRLTRVAATANDVTLEWETADSRCAGKPFEIERQNPTSMAWEKICEVPAGTTNYVYRRFTVDRTNRWRISCDVTEE